MDERTLKRMEEEIDKQLANYIKPPNTDKVKVKVTRSIVELQKFSENSNPRLDNSIKPFAEPLE